MMTVTVAVISLILSGRGLGRVAQLYKAGQAGGQLGQCLVGGLLAVLLGLSSQLLMAGLVPGLVWLARGGDLVVSAVPEVGVFGNQSSGEPCGVVKFGGSGPVIFDKMLRRSMVVSSPSQSSSDRPRQLVMVS